LTTYYFYLAKKEKRVGVNDELRGSDGNGRAKLRLSGEWVLRLLIAAKFLK